MADTSTETRKRRAIKAMDIGSDLLPGGGPIFDIGRDVYNMFTGRRRRQNPQKSGGYTETAAERKRRLEKSSGN